MKKRTVTINKADSLVSIKVVESSKEKKRNAY